ncbi:hypothetical protein [Flavobacterium sp. 140616W15]|uniref:hypothetical protein n=1 Tax=Flavobacterium sp. 140616W15 TaxID=2478552 RepID=UPI000F0CD5ED|nr:hypothetical protein [Flavobacterium sp. 140616W15]AYN03321.1 hypothetical protein EAG11_03385 [Flavobacterium sp. 140616W15]
MLSELLKGNSCSDNKQNTELQNTSIRICKSLNLIKLSLSGKKYELTESGILVFSDGGIEKYLFNIRTEKDLDSDIKQLTLKKLKLEQFPARFWWLIIIITSIISVLTTLVNNQIEKSINQQEQPKKEIILSK